MVMHVSYLPWEREAERSRASVLSRYRLPASIYSFEAADQQCRLEEKWLYKHGWKNFPIACGFFLVDAVSEGVSLSEGAEAPTQAMVLLKVTKTRYHHTKTSKVKRFLNRMAETFTNWDEMESRLRCEIIYLLHADSATIKTRQRCDSGGMACDAGIEEFCDGIGQLLVKLFD
ncbi:unnamed protein product [Trypanosoma congolense IL3000]|uniref:WGS project CAEQ00000000 data, annotated contig 632 n=1 Tax=Trypanosoma congolense (strain IL3000) TaxID=1068625 RepID=F9WHD8_TRYCI|nr:unnamed protein product [Trypanosoma congolense IL3000]